MLSAILEVVKTLGPIVLLMFLPILIPLIAVGISALAGDRGIRS